MNQGHCSQPSCPECGQPVPMMRGKGRPRKYCTDKCRYDARLVAQNAAHRDRYAQLREAGATPIEAFHGRDQGTFMKMMKALKAGERPSF